MLKKTILLFIVIIFLGITICFAEDVTPGQDKRDQDFEWSDYGLNFKWAKDKKLLKQLELTVQQENELGKLANAAEQNSKTDEDIVDKETQLKRQIELKSLIKINGQFTQPDQAVIDSLIAQLAKLRSDKYTNQMSLKGKLRMLLTEKQRNILFDYFLAKGKELRDKFREQMKEQMGEHGDMGSHRGMEGMGGMGHGGFGGRGGF